MGRKAKRRQARDESAVVASCSHNTTTIKETSDDMPTIGRRRTSSLKAMTVIGAIALLAILPTSTAVQMPDWSKIPTPPIMESLSFENNDTEYFISEPDNVPVMEGGSNGKNLYEVTLKCKARGVPPPQYVWQKIADVFPTSNQSACSTIDVDESGNQRCWYDINTEMQSNRITPVAGEGTIQIQKLDKPDAGTYRCLAYNRNGTAVGKPIQLVMAFSQRFSNDKPQVVEVKLNHAYSRKCNVPPSIPPPRVWWIFKSAQDETGITNFDSINKTHISGDEEGNIYFHYVKHDDYVKDKYYTCTVHNEVLDEYKFGEQFQIQVNTDDGMALDPSRPPTQQKISPSEEIAIVGRSHRFYCFYAGIPEPTPTWVGPNQVAFLRPDQTNSDSETNERIKWYNYGKSMEILSVQYEDRGYYECKFPDQPSLNHRMYLDVEAAPSFPVAPSSVNASEGQTVSFQCMASAKPDAQIEFFKNGRPMSTGGNIRIDNTKLTIGNVHKRPEHCSDVRPGAYGDDGDCYGDNAVYQCRASNRHGTVWANFYLNILDFAPVSLGTSPADGMAKGVMDGKADLKCKFFGSPSPTVYWYRVGESGKETLLTPSQQYSFDNKVDDDGWATLTVNNLRNSAIGDYRCAAGNKNGNASQVVELKIMNATRIIRDPQLNQEEMTLVAGQEIRIPCNAIIDDHLKPTASVEWWQIAPDYPMPVRIDFDKHRPRLDMLPPEQHYTLVIREPQKKDTSRYECRVRTILDNVTIATDIKIRDVPDKPQNLILHCNDTDPNKAERTVGFNVRAMERIIEAHKTDIEEFWVQYRLVNTDDNRKTIHAWSTFPEPITPKFNKEVNTLDNKYHVISTRGRIGLPTWGTYEFRVLARNDIGMSAPTLGNGLCMIPAAQPDTNPLNVRAKGKTPDDVTVYWTPMPRDDWNGPNFHYIVKYRPKGSDEDFEEVEVKDPYADHVSIPVDEDAPWRPYQVQVQAVNDEGTSKVEPQTIEGHSGQGVPLRSPDGFEVLEIHTGKSVTFRWDQYDHNAAQGPLKGFKVYHWKAEDNGKSEQSRFKRQASKQSVACNCEIHPNCKQAIFGPSVTSGTVNDLAADSLNYAYLVAFNDEHESPCSEVLDFNTPIAIPDQVEALNVHAIHPNEIVATWSPPVEPNGPVTEYEVERCEVHDGELDESTCEKIEPVTPDDSSPQMQAQIENLKPNQEYEVVVRAKTPEPHGGAGLDNRMRTKTLPKDVPSDVNPYPPKVRIIDVGDDHINASWIPGHYDSTDPRSPGTVHEFKYRPEGEDEWLIVSPEEGESFHSTLRGLEPGTRYEVVAVSKVQDPAGQWHEANSNVQLVQTQGGTRRGMSLWWLIILLIIIICLLLILCLVCLIVRNRGANYPVSKKEREQGREPMLANEERPFNEYAGRGPAGERASLVSGKPESETDSMAEDGEGDAGRFTEDGSFIGQYVPSNKLTVATAPESKTAPSTFV